MAINQEQEFVRIVDEWHGYCLQTARRNLPQALRSSAEDVVQEALLIAWRQLKAGRFRGDSSMQTWLVHTVLGHAWNVRQREARHVHVDVAECEAAEWGSHHARNIEARLIRDELWTKAMASLSPTHQEFLQDWLGDKFKGCMKGSSEKSMLYRAMAQLRSFAAANLL